MAVKLKYILYIIPFFGVTQHNFCDKAVWTIFILKHFFFYIGAPLLGKLLVSNPPVKDIGRQKEIKTYKFHIKTMDHIFLETILSDLLPWDLSVKSI